MVMITELFILNTLNHPSLRFTLQKIRIESNTQGKLIIYN